MRDEKLHDRVARSTFGSQNVRNTPFSDHFWKLRCRKSARCSGAKHMWKSKCTKHLMFGRLLEVEMSKKCTPLHYTTLHYTTQRDTNYNYNYNYKYSYITLHYTNYNYSYKYSYNYSYNYSYITLHYAPLHYTTLH